MGRGGERGAARQGDQPVAAHELQAVAIPLKFQAAHRGGLRGQAVAGHPLIRDLLARRGEHGGKGFLVARLKAGAPTQFGQLVVAGRANAPIRLSEIAEVVPTEYRADLVVALYGHAGKPILAIVVEVQLTRDKGKHKAWPVYITHLGSRSDCPTALLVVAPDPAIARWCAQPIETGHPRFVLHPLVTGPEAIPVIVDTQNASQAPELAVLSAMAHGAGKMAQTVAEVALHAVKGLDDNRARLYADLVVSSLPEAVRSALEKLMESGKYEYQSNFARKYFAQGREEGRLVGRQEGLKEGQQQGRQEGIIEGQQQGEVAALAVALLEVLKARELKVSTRGRQRILACTNTEQLKLWLRQSVTVSALAELFTSERPMKVIGRKPLNPRSKR